MPCPRCGGNKTPRPTPPPSVISRPGSVVPTPASGPRPASNPTVRDAITGLRYVPSK